MNNVTLIGRLTADPELKKTPSGLSVTSFNIAVDRHTKEKQTDFISIVAWRGLAETITKYFTKGSRIAIQGSIQTRQYEDKLGNKRNAFEIVANNIDFIDKKQDPMQSFSENLEKQEFKEAPEDFGDLPF